jgi:glycosyltransferase involved in cell wall biosynthesis
MDHPQKTIVEMAYAMGGVGAVAARARTELAVGARYGYEMIGVSDSLKAPLPGLDVYSASTRSLLGVLPGGIGELGAVVLTGHTLRKVTQRAKPDLIVFHNSTLGWPAVAVARRLGTASAFVVHALVRDRIAAGANPYGVVMTRAYIKANEFALKNADRIICVSEAIAESAACAGAASSRIRVVPNPVDLEQFPTARVSRDSKSREVDVLFVGRLSVEKGVDTLLEALAGLRSSVRVQIVGDGPQRGALERRAANLHHQIEFLGWQEHSVVLELMAGAKVQAVPSTSEPQGVVVLEALLSGTPVIGSRVGGIPEMVRHGENGWLVPPADAPALRNVIRMALSDLGGLDRMRRCSPRSARTFGMDQFERNFERSYF